MVAEMRALGEKIRDSVACPPGEMPAEFVERDTSFYWIDVRDAGARSPS